MDKSRVVKLIICCLMAPTNPGVPMNHPEQVLGIPVVFTGEPGTGKSSTVAALCAEINLPYAEINMGRTLIEQLTGLPVADGKGGVRFIPIDEGLKGVADMGGGVVFFDEINMAGVQEQKLLQAGLTTKRIGGTYLGARARMIAVKNPAESATGHTDFTAPVANRFVHLTWDSPTGEVYRDWRTGNGMKFNNKSVLPKGLQEHMEKSAPKPAVDCMEDYIAQQWDTVNPRISAMIMAYHRAVSSSIHACPEPGSPQAAMGWPSPRTWFMLERVLTVCAILEFGPEIMVDLVNGCIGEGTGKAFVTWMNNSDIPEPAEVLANGFKPDVRLDRCMAVYLSLAQYVPSMKDVPTRNAALLKVWNIYNSAKDAGQGDVLITPVKQLLTAGMVTGISPDQPLANELGKAANALLTKMKMLLG